MPTFLFFRKARPVGERVQGADLGKLKSAIKKLLAGAGDGSGAPRLAGGDGSAPAPPPEICQEVELEEERVVEEEPEGMTEAPNLGAILMALGWLSDEPGLQRSL